MFFNKEDSVLQVSCKTDLTGNIDKTVSSVQKKQDVIPWIASTLLKKPVSSLINEMWNADPPFRDILLASTTIDNARKQLLFYLNKKENNLFDSLLPNESVGLNITERCNAKECIRVFKNIIRTENESRSGFSALQLLQFAAKNRFTAHSSVKPAFVCEIISLLHGINGRGLTFLPQCSGDDDLSSNDHVVMLDRYAKTMNLSFKKFVRGTDNRLQTRHSQVKSRILEYCKSNESDWFDYHWQLRNVFTDTNSIKSIVTLGPDELAGLEQASIENIPVQITPFYLSLFNPDGRDDTDRAIRAQVLPTETYCKTVAANHESGVDMDFMGEQFTSPIEGITRRYPNIVILKPFDSCPQICVYCQRNWEIRDLKHTAIETNKIDIAIDWIRDHDEISEVLVTGGDPLTLNNTQLGKIIDSLSGINHIERIRIGTRTIVTMPCRIDNGLINLLRAYHKPGKLEIAIMTHVEHATELTTEVIEAIAKIRRCGISIYNQQVFTYYNSRQFETAFLRKNLRLCGIDPYYTFNTKGKEETADFRVPIARLLQERKEEARIMPGIARTDEPVFNVPRLGKSHLRSWQDHEPIMILGDGRRVYRFLPWESRLSLSDDYLYTDVSIYDYLKRLQLDGEDIDLYRSIWYYF
jgi:lysine 2,3-aminomutase